jgi:BioD-like phosphotransacetylase family protein
MLISESNSTDMSHNRKLAEASNSKILLVADSIEKAQKAKEELGEHLAGIIYNNISRHRIDSARPSSGDGILSVIPENRHMVSSTVDQYVKHLKGKYIYESDKKNELVLNVLIGGIVLDWSVLYYKSQENVLALIRGDRPDLQLGALQAGGNVKGIVLTKGIEPIEYVTYEAKKLQIPLILVDYNTHEAADKISGIVSKSKFDHVEKLESCLSHFASNLSQRAVDKAMDLNTL